MASLCPLEPPLGGHSRLGLQPLAVHGYNSRCFGLRSVWAFKGSSWTGSRMIPGHSSLTVPPSGHMCSCGDPAHTCWCPEVSPGQPVRHKLSPFRFLRCQLCPTDSGHMARALLVALKPVSQGWRRRGGGTMSVTASPEPSFQLSLLSFIQPQVHARSGSLAKFSVSLCRGSREFLLSWGLS